MDLFVTAAIIRTVLIGIIPRLHHPKSFYWNLAPLVLILGFVLDIVVLGKDSILMFIGFFFLEFFVIGRYLVLLLKEKHSVRP